jgi:Arc/MetJ-type ribon-helix-helix transcriptional regulator
MRCKILIMKRTQIQIPDPLYKEVKRLAALREWSISEVFRRAVEDLLDRYPPVKRKQEWSLPEPRDFGRPAVPPEKWRDLLSDDESGVLRDS